MTLLISPVSIIIVVSIQWNWLIVLIIDIYWWPINEVTDVDPIDVDHVFIVDIIDKLRAPIDPVLTVIEGIIIVEVTQYCIVLMIHYWYCGIIIIIVYNETEISKPMSVLTWSPNIDQSMKWPSDINRHYSSSIENEIVNQAMTKNQLIKNIIIEIIDPLTEKKSIQWPISEMTQLKPRYCRRNVGEGGKCWPDDGIHLLAVMTYWPVVGNRYWPDPLLIFPSLTSDIPSPPVFSDCWYWLIAVMTDRCRCCCWYCYPIDPEMLVSWHWNPICYCFTLLIISSDWPYSMLLLTCWWPDD